MHAKILLQKNFTTTSSHIHAARWNAVKDIVEPLLEGANLTLTALGRKLSSKAKTKHNIKRVDRLINNRFLYSERNLIYQDICNFWLAPRKELFIIIDWSPYSTKGSQVLKASMIAKGHAVTLYNEVHPEAKLNNAKVHKDFLKKLHQLISPNHEVTIITDAGFKNPWFKAVEDLGWNFIGRIRGLVEFKGIKDDKWQKVSEFEDAAYIKAYYCGEKIISKTNPIQAHMYRHKKKIKYQNLNRNKCPRDNNRMSKSAHEGWIIVSSYSPDKFSASKIMQIYSKRMQIESIFRDTKSHKYGLGLGLSKSKSIVRQSNLLLLATIALFVLWLLGLAAEMKKMQYAYQANTVKSHRVLSLITLGKSVYEHDRDKIAPSEIGRAVAKFLEEYYSHVFC